MKAQLLSGAVIVAGEISTEAWVDLDDFYATDRSVPDGETATYVYSP